MLKRIWSWYIKQLEKPMSYLWVSFIIGVIAAVQSMPQ